MSATRSVINGMDSGQESVALTAIVEALKWRQAAEIVSDRDYQRIGKRVIIYPSYLSKFGTVAATGNVGFDLEGGHDIAYQRIVNQCRSLRDDCQPTLIREDADLSEWPGIAEKVPIWMATARQVAVGGHKKVPENGPDTCNSESDSENEQHVDILKRMYTEDMLGPDGEPKNGGPVVLSEEQVRAQRAAARQAKSRVKSTT
jgi:hypothetical protein